MSDIIIPQLNNILSENKQNICVCQDCQHHRQAENGQQNANRDIKYRSFVFTSYDEKLPDFNDEEHKKLFTWICVKQEKCPSTGRLHWQGCGTPKNQIKFGRLRKLLGDKVWIDKMRGTHKQARDYVAKKETAVGDILEFGHMPEPGISTEFRLACAEVLAGKRKAIDFIEDNPILYHTYGRTLEAAEIQHHKRNLPKNVLAKENLNIMQQYVLDLALKPKEDRLIHWIVDEKGGAGKSAMIRYLIVNHGATLLGLSYKDSAEAYDKQGIVCFDIERDTKEEFIPYALFEALKNGMIFSGKYHGVTKIFDPPHVFIFANRHPNKEKLSQDRWRIVDTQNIIYCNNEMKDEPDFIPDSPQLEWNELPPVPHQELIEEIPPPSRLERQQGLYRTYALTNEERNRIQREMIEID